MEEDKRVDEIRYNFYYKLGVKWTKQQEEYFERYLISMLPSIYGDKWEANKQRVLGDKD